MKLGIFFSRFSENTQISDVMKIPSVVAAFFHADGETDGRDEANGSFSQFCDGG
jgi:hypothetical protein